MKGKNFVFNEGKVSPNKKSNDQFFNIPKEETIEENIVTIIITNF